MTTEEAQKVLDELDNVRPELLNDDAKRLFEAIMRIADERDYYKTRYLEFTDTFVNFKKEDKQ